MKLTLKHKVLIGISCIVAFLIITNPSIQAFKEYIGSNTYQGLHRDRNFFVASVYTYHRAIYLGFVGNFIRKGFQHVEAERDTINNKIDLTVLSYKERVYLALKENLKGFTDSQQEFDNKIKDRTYALKVYKALKDTLSGFDKTPDEFLKLINS